MQEKNSLEIMRHSLSHVMAAAVKQLYPDVKFAIGPSIENGFYYDFDFGTEKISEENLAKIEKKMKEIIKRGFAFEKTEMDIDKAIAKEEAEGQVYKVELLKDLKAGGEKVASYYQSGDFSDLCRGPHVATNKDLPVDGFKLNKLAGAYWRGDEKNKMLTRIYAVAFASKDELGEYLKMLEEAGKRDHRKLGKELELFMIDPVVGLGLAMWQPKGAMLWRIMEDFWYKAHLDNDYELVRTPHIGSRQLWETSGHWGFYSDSMYPPLEVGRSLEDVKAGNKTDAPTEEYLLKPMNCPFHVMLYNSKPRSYKELPVRWAECGTVYRYEKSGELSGLTRVRGFTQDDAHIICTKDQVKDELKRVTKFITYIFTTFGFTDYKVYLSLRDSKNKEKYTGNDEGWEFTQKVLEEVAQEENLDYIKEEGEAAFYGPKLDYKVRDCLGREWQCSTLQFDFNLPERFDMAFINAKGEKEKPFMLHRALFGSFERFVGVLIEHYAGAFPVWLSPVQVRILALGEKHNDYCQALVKEFKLKGIRADVDINNETVGNKIRKAIGEKIPYVAVIGDKEMESGELSVRERGNDKSANIAKDQFIEQILANIRDKK